MSKPGANAASRAVERTFRLPLSSILDSRRSAEQGDVRRADSPSRRGRPRRPAQVFGDLADLVTSTCYRVDTCEFHF